MKHIGDGGNRKTSERFMVVVTMNMGDVSIKEAKEKVSSWSTVP